jgi:hypothetical protein
MSPWIAESQFEGKGLALAFPESATILSQFLSDQDAGQQ